MKNLILFLALLAQLVFADPVSFTFQDNSDNEDGFIVEALANGEWIETQRLAANVTEFEIADASQYEGARVWSYLIDSWGREVRSSGPAENLVDGGTVADPTGLQIKSETVTEQITRTTVTEYHARK
jgi:hypothetical protein